MMLRTVTAASFALLASAATAQVQAQDSLGDSLAASGASVSLGADLAASGVRTASAVAVLPAGSVAIGSGVAGSVAGGVAGRALLDTAGGVLKATGRMAQFAQGPLPVSREVVVAPQPVPRLPYAAQGPHP